MKPSHTIRPVFDDQNLVSTAGLVPVLRLAEAAGLYDLLGEHAGVGSPNPVTKAACVVAGMLAGADSIDDLDLLRHGGMGRLFTGLGARRRWGLICGLSPTAMWLRSTRCLPGCWPG